MQNLTLTLDLPTISIVVFVLITQAWAWTRSSDYDAWFPSARTCSILFVSVLDFIFILLVGGIFLW